MVLWIQRIRVTEKWRGGRYVATQADNRRNLSRLCIRSITLISGQVMRNVISLQAALIQWRVEHSTYSDR